MCIGIHKSYMCQLLYVQAIHVTQEQRGSLKLEAYSHLLQELLIMQLHQVSIASAEQTHSSDIMQVMSESTCQMIAVNTQVTDTRHMGSVAPLLSSQRPASSSKCHVHWHQAESVVQLVGPSTYGGLT